MSLEGLGLVSEREADTPLDQGIRQIGPARIQLRSLIGSFNPSIKSSLNIAFWNLLCLNIYSFNAIFGKSCVKKCEEGQVGKCDVAIS
jgi:hypothetical protein